MRSTCWLEGGGAPRGSFAERAVIVVFSLAALAATSCSSGSGGDVLDPGGLDPTGQWAASYTVTSDSCGHWQTVPTTVFFDGQVTKQGDQLIARVEGAPCADAVTFDFDGETATRTQSTTITQGTCTYQSAETTTLTFDQDGYDGTTVATNTPVSGNCSQVPEASCQEIGTESGARCQGCYGGCV